VKQSAASVRRVTTQLYWFVFFNDFILLYPVYALLFTDHGLTVNEVAALFAIWSLTAILSEVPSGVVADVVSRRALVVTSPLLAGLGYAVWGLFPSFSAFAFGFILWGLGSALRSGALEALVYDELNRHGAASTYVRVLGRSKAVAAVALLAATAATALLFPVTGYPVVVVASVAASLVAAGFAARLPTPPQTPQATTLRQYRDMLADAVGRIRRRRSVRHAVVLVVAITVIWGSLEEYIPLLAAESTELAWLVVPMVLAVSLGQAAGGLVADRAAALSTPVAAGLLAVSAAAMAGGALLGHPAGFVLIAAAFAVFQMLTVVADATLQSVIDGPSRATVTSLAGLGIDLAGIGVYLSYGAAVTVYDNATGFAGFAMVYLLVAALWVGHRFTGSVRG